MTIVTQLTPLGLFVARRFLITFHESVLDTCKHRFKQRLKDRSRTHTSPVVNDNKGGC